MHEVCIIVWSVYIIERNQSSDIPLFEDKRHFAFLILFTEVGFLFENKITIKAMLFSAFDSNLITTESVQKRPVTVTISKMV